MALMTQTKVVTLNQKYKFKVNFTSLDDLLKDVSANVEKRYPTTQNALEYFDPLVNDFLDFDENLDLANDIIHLKIIELQFKGVTNLRSFAALQPPPFNAPQESKATTSEDRMVEETADTPAQQENTNSTADGLVPCSSTDTREYSIAPATISPTAKADHFIPRGSMNMSKKSYTLSTIPSSIAMRRNSIAYTHEKKTDSLGPTKVNEEWQNILNERKILSIMEEIISSEKVFCQKLEMAVLIYNENIKLNLDKELLDKLFGNVEELSISHNSLLSKLELMRKQPLWKVNVNPTTFTQIFLDHPGLLLAPRDTDNAHLRYFSQFHISLSTRSWMRHSYQGKAKHKMIQQLLNGGEGIDQLLILPIQRIPRYALLFKELKNQLKVTSMILPTINTAVLKFNRLASVCNDVSGPLMSDCDNSALSDPDRLTYKSSISCMSGDQQFLDDNSSSNEKLNEPLCRRVVRFSEETDKTKTDSAERIERDANAALKRSKKKLAKVLGIPFTDLNQVPTLNPTLSSLVDAHASDADFSSPSQEKPKRVISMPKSAKKKIFNFSSPDADASSSSSSSRAVEHTAFQSHTKEGLFERLSIVDWEKELDGGGSSDSNNTCSSTSRSYNASHEGPIPSIRSHSPSRVQHEGQAVEDGQGGHALELEGSVDQHNTYSHHLSVVNSEDEEFDGPDGYWDGDGVWHEGEN